MWRRKLLVTLAGLLVFAAFIYAPCLSLITRRNYDRIQVGMTQDEVEAILGSPGDFRNAENEYDMAPEHQPADVFGRGNPSGNLTTLWRSDAADVGLNFDQSGKVGSGIFCYMRTTSHDPLHNLQWRAQRRWRFLLGCLDYVTGGG
jgi:hypothetical protein